MNTKKKTMTGADIFFESLRKEGVEKIFGYPGGATIKLYEKLYDVKFLEHILTRHEQGATHAADGYARVSGKVGVVLVTSGPGATNTVTGIANAYMDSVPLVIFTGQVPSHLIGNDAFQEADIVGITRPITKHNFLVRDVKDLASTIKKAFYIAATGRPGPVLVDLPKDVIAAECEFEYPETVEIRGYKPTLKGHSNQIKKAAEVIRNAKRPLLYVGGGVIMANASKELTEFAKKNNIPVTNTLLGLGSFPGTDPQFLGMLGMHGTYYANQAVSNCDVLIAVGARFDDRVTGNTKTFAKEAYKIHIDIDPTAIDKNVAIDLPIVGNAKEILTELLKELSDKPREEAWFKQIEDWKDACPLEYKRPDNELRTQFVIEKISEKTKGEAIIISDVGQHQMWIAQYYKFNNPRSHVSSGGLGTMGFSIPAAVGVAFAIKDRPIVSISGDGGFQMNMQELITAAYHKLPIKFFIMNNCFLGMVRQWQELFHEEKYSFTDLCDSNPIFTKIGTALGIESFSTYNPDEVEELLDKVFAINDRPVLVEFKVAKEDLVFPMVPSGGSISDMIHKRINPKGKK
ncbi:MAG: biosynthetic-type acetolactate synthase large subunit [Bacteroidetes bacterium]|nr:biosynthetic-type acetolactate synthase large subunit [Bacteroidota bacterium]MBU1115058.1 biosynthetic-type acetolactate synthase large subunit [Bacteroidota bacterium]MBU1797160.1 biosynthetic-type acetolactate synthase large subunit [Bacteroidota bacterium]